MKVRINKIKIPKERLRTTSGKSIDDLKDSIKKIGLIHPIVINEAYKLIAGDRRLRAAKELGWKEIDANIVKNLTPLQEFDIELHENWVRENFTNYELASALEKRKKIYEKEHPETTVEEKYTKQERDPKGRFGGKISEESKLVTSVGKEKSQIKIKPAERFTKNAAKVLGVSETQVKRHLQAVDAVEKKKVPKKVVKEYKNGKIKSYEVVKHLRGLKKKKEEKPESKKKVEIKIEEPEEEKFYCMDCKKAVDTSCPYCNILFYQCKEKGNRKSDQEACDKFEQ